MTAPRGFRVHWTHPTSEDRSVGDLWPNRETAEEIARMLREAGCRDVEIKVAYQ